MVAPTSPFDAGAGNTQLRYVALRLVVFIGVGVYGSDLASGQSPAEQYLPAIKHGWANIQASLRDLDAAGVATYSLRDNDELVASRARHFTIQIGNGNKLVRVKEVADSEQNSNDRLRVSNSQYVFVLKPSGNKEWHVLKAGEGADVRQRVERALSRSGLEYAEVPLRIAEKMLPEMCEEPGFKLTDIVERITPTGMVARVSFDYLPKDGDASPIRGGWVDLVPDLDWAIRQYSVSLDYGERGKGKLEGEVEYDGFSNLVVPAKYSAKITMRDKGSDQLNSIQFVYDRFERHAPSKEVFFLENYGLPETVATLRPVDNGGGRIAMLGATCLIIALLLHLIAKRNRSRHTAPT